MFRERNHDKIFRTTFPNKHMYEHKLYEQDVSQTYIYSHHRIVACVHYGVLPLYNINQYSFTVKLY